jgi:hypothetical protein
MSKSLSGLKVISDGAGTIIENGNITTNSETITGNLYLSGAIANGSNVISFNEPYQFTDFNHNIHVYGNMLLDFQNITYNVGAVIAAGTGGGGGSYPSITYSSSTNETTFSGGLIFPTSSISSASINNSDFVTLSTTQNVSSSKTFSQQQNFQNSIRLDGSLLLNSAALTLTNSNLQKIQYLSNINTDISASLLSSSSKLTAVSYAVGVSGNPNVTTVSDKLQCSVVSFSNTLNGVSTTTFGYISTLSANAENRLVSNANDIQVLKDITRNLTSTSSQSTFSQTLNSSIFTFATSINGFSYNDFSNAITYTKNLTSDASASILALQNKTQYLTYSSNNSSFSNTLNSSTFVFSNTINGFNVTDFSNCITYCKTLTSSAQEQITAAAGTAASASAGVVLNTAAITAITTLSIPGLQSQITAQGVLIGNNTDAISTLNQKTTGISYSNATTKTSINLLDVTTFRLTNLESGFTQNVNQPVIIIGTCEHRNGLSVTNGFGLSVDGGITQNNNSANTFNGSVSCVRDFTTSGTNSNLNSSNIQIGTASAAALTVNATSSFNSDVTLSATKKFVVKNIVPRNLDDIYFGGEAGAYTNYTEYHNMKVSFNEPVSVLANYKQGTTALRYTSESFNTTYSVTANTSVSLSSPLVSIGNLLSSTTIYGNLVVIGSITNATGILNVFGQALQQF